MMTMIGSISCDDSSFIDSLIHHIQKKIWLNLSRDRWSRKQLFRILGINRKWIRVILNTDSMSVFRQGICRVLWESYYSDVINILYVNRKFHWNSWIVIDLGKRLLVEVIQSFFFLLHLRCRCRYYQLNAKVFLFARKLLRVIVKQIFSMSRRNKT